MANRVDLKRDIFDRTASELGIPMASIPRMGKHYGHEEIHDMSDDLVLKYLKTGDPSWMPIYPTAAVRGVRVGDEISVISGNNDWALIAGLHPSLTTFDIHAHDIGRLAMRQMESRLRMKESLPDANLAIERHLIPRKSVRTLTT